MYSTILVRDVLRSKGHGYLGMPPEATAYAALEVMAEHDVGALLVMEEGGKLVGVFSERDYARKVILQGKSSRSTTVGELMSAPAISVSSEMDLQTCMVLMTKNHVRHLPVVDQGDVIGIVSIGDVVGWMIRTQEATIHQLENYISGDDYPARVATR